ncbi:phosphoribosylaminoimidazole carboxylase [Sphaeroforma arctica JP610]|uniref:phosphoribosylaminoimidazole carboxylase n=1 Tax=Sphaeroforma arctica JP610 TaxID=667725 RepID=A0A0L0FWL2_9EUKA|nr:phosphoribosylaminoimidazole carboxylase [Sphaeroforma arctica JP610]KNC81225.1 phosphoribosylaminoimidazole carboxylase [Sphaeroforma arctica JP610]|eukprot:XP_014155127.1 phosphoribosylaminoimidazole carboxylase [Sphaeroforma arctica JP610]
MAEIEQTTNIPIYPSAKTVRIIQDKFVQKEFLISKDIDVVPSRSVQCVEDVVKLGEEFGYPMMLKAKKLAYDGRGNSVVESAADVRIAFDSLGGRDLYVEKWFQYTMELAVMVVRAIDGTIRTYPVVETIQKDNICHTVIAPARIPAEVAERAQALAADAIRAFDGCGAVGVFGVEMFVDKDMALVVNEIAPRPHNSGHYTIEACYTSQFENHLRAVLGLPLGDCSLKVGGAVMVNILGSGTSLDATWQPFARALSLNGASLHWYGKSAVKQGRKMGHITFTAASLATALSISEQVTQPNSESSNSSDSQPVVGIIMGSDSDLPTMKAAAQILEKFEVPFEVTIVSAHRTPARLVEYGNTARSRGLKVIIAAAGGAAHLPGMTAALTPLPVIGVPIPLKYLDGVDSLYSICQMPRGVPVATVAIGNSTNAALLAIRMLGVADDSLNTRMENYLRASEQEVLGKVDKLREIGWKAYGEN